MRVQGEKTARGITAHLRKSAVQTITRNLPRLPPIELSFRQARYTSTISLSPTIRASFPHQPATILAHISYLTATLPHSRSRSSIPYPIYTSYHTIIIQSTVKPPNYRISPFPIVISQTHLHTIQLINSAYIRSTQPFVYSRSNAIPRPIAHPAHPKTPPNALIPLQPLSVPRRTKNNDCA